MIHNSFDFSLAETSSLAKLESEDNPSWINLRQLKDAIKMTTDRSHYDESDRDQHLYRNSHKRASISVIRSYSSGLNNILDSYQSVEAQPSYQHVDTPLSTECFG